MGTSVGEWNERLRCIEVDLTATPHTQDVVTVALPSRRRVVVALTKVIAPATGDPYEVLLVEWGNCQPYTRIFTTSLPGGPDAVYRIRAVRYEGPCSAPGSPENDTSTPTGLIEPERKTIAQWIWHFGDPLEMESAFISIMTIDEVDS